MSPKVSVIYVNYKSGKDLLESVQSLIASKPKVSYQVVVVDNSPKDKVSGKLKKLRKNVIYIKSIKNLGYGGGNNLGAEKAEGKYLFILNPDTLLRKDTIDELSNFLDKRNNVAVAAPNLADKKDKTFSDIGARELTPVRAIFSLSFIAKIFPNNRVKKEYRLDDLRKDEMREAVAVPGSAFMIRKCVFEKVGRFDEKMFMYFEEADLGKRVKEAGYKTYINPKAQVIHKWEQKGDKPEKLKKIFEKSRFYYFKKHFGLLNAIVVEIFTRFSLLGLLVLIALLFGCYLRFTELDRFVRFSGDTGFYFLLARNIFTKGEFPLVSIATSVPVFRQGAVFIWMLGIVLKIFDYNPMSGFYFTAFINSVALILFYLVVKDIFDKKLATVSTILACFSPILISHSRRVSVISPIFLFTIVTFWLFSRALRSKGTLHYFLLGVVLSILLQFELAAFTLFIVFAITFLVLRRTISIRQAIYTGIGAVLGAMPFIVYDIKNGVFIQTIGFLTWVITKPFENLLIPSAEMTTIDYGAGMNLVSRGILPQLPFVSIITLFLSLFVFIKDKKKQLVKLNPEVILIILWFLVTYSSFLARGIFSDAYMPFTFIPTLLILSVIIILIFKKRKFLGCSILFSVVAINTVFVIDSNFMMGKRNRNTLKHKIAVSNYVINDSEGENYELIYAGVGDMYESGGDNYEYLLWWLGKEPMKGANTSYRIVSRASVGDKEAVEDVLWIGDVGIVKSRK